jgi:hypothetical protein
MVCLAVAGLALGACGTEDGDDDGGGTGPQTAGDDGMQTGDDGDDDGGTAQTAGDDDGMDDAMATAGDDGMDDGTTAGDGMDDGADETTDDGGATCDPPCEADQQCVAGMCIGGKDTCEPGMCDTCETQEECIPCAQMGECVAENNACAMNAECVALNNCNAACPMGDMECINGCFEMHPDGEDDLLALLQCIQGVCL